MTLQRQLSYPDILPVAADLLPPISSGLLATTIDFDALVGSIFDAICGQVSPTYSRDARFAAALRHCVHGNVTAVVELVAGRLSLETVRPEWALAFADLCADLHVPLAQLERVYWVGVQRFWEEWFHLSCTASEGVDATLGDLLGDPTHILFSYVLQVLDQVVRRYDARVADLAGSTEDQRRVLVSRLLDGSVAAGGQGMDHLLSYQLDGSHIALLVESGDREMVDKALRELRACTGARGALVVPQESSAWMAWLGFPARTAGDRVTRLKRAAEVVGVTVSVGAPGEGVVGLRRSHGEALRVARLRQAWPDAPACLTYEDVRLESFLLCDEEAARRFVVEELGELAGPSERAQRIRQTLLAWLSTGSQSRTAALLGVHDNTVRLRIRAGRDVLGSALDDRRTELLVALRLRHALAETPGPPR